MSIEFRNVAKVFPRHAGNLLLRSHLARLFSRNGHKDFVALQEITFRLEDGESVLLVGPNGAGKSTLLSLAAGVAAPDRGEVAITGRVAALLELGSGFHYDLTGMENTRVNASLLGLSRQEYAAVLPSILEFAELGDFIDEPVRTYSAGMVMRLAFSVAVHTNPQLLMVDEVLGVGDAAFQTKCRERIRSLKASGVTFLCASHAPQTLLDLCEKALWLDHGRMIDFGPAAEVSAAYLANTDPMPAPRPPQLTSPVSKSPVEPPGEKWKKSKTGRSKRATAGGG